ncbi:3-methylcrotonyl-CoA carboxylase subunit alpha [Desulfuromonas versatilis]|uniref:3-methylcrotonyl-CoA carboxylase subunit alpha n=1 Tax=Desulfuromonas versatilis TaxID=2802975 RepID=A0ABM8HW29_9BACT|nr:acetyl/propionyl/methylcrotonyl-CoA carboxylase subunit alpha [Desulfuromonas versatilis]BCR04917.1 3-methylcrotonyl-CoA carboxylase subunit alpha [Desulfuromonas versatilis]
MFDKILVANRGEIACRIIRTARRLGVATVAVYSEADAGALHVELADEAWPIGPAPARESYLCIDKLIDAAHSSGARAIHPGYGFLAENEGFAEACARAGIAFIGPPAAAIRAMGSKSAAKNLMEQAGIPLVPGYHGDDQQAETLREAARAIGYPLLIKASAGGGGKGMRVVRGPADFDAALASARREAASAFGDDRVLLEKYLERPRHVEIQVFADSQGNALHLFERDCSIQRRHQKILEEAPAPGMPPELRGRMGEAAVAAARAIGYLGAGTVEFLLAADGRFYFMEMNTRLQVEHPVTEMITGQDLVEWQLRVAAGAPLPCRQEDLTLCGHAIEARVYAEDPAREFLPSTGVLAHLRPPQPNPHVRVDTGVRQGDAVSIHYDPMIAKLIVWDQDRPSALRRLQKALADYQVVGVATNLQFLAAVAAHPAYQQGDFDTHFIERHHEALFPGAEPASDEILALACLDILLHRRREAEEVSRDSPDPWSPWHQANGWRLNSDNYHVLTLLDEERLLEVTAHFRDDCYLLELPGRILAACGEYCASGDLLARLDGRQTRATVVRRGRQLTIMHGGRSHCLMLHDPAAGGEEQHRGGGRLTAPMPGKVIAVSVEAGKEVKRGTPLITLEAMKMEHTIAAPADGTVARVNFRVGDLVSEGEELIAFEAAEAG